MNTKSLEHTGPLDARRPLANPLADPSQRDDAAEFERYALCDRDGDGDVVVPTPREILLRRAQIHRDRDDLVKAQWLEQEAAEAASAADDDHTFDSSLAEAGFDESFCELMSAQRVWSLGQLIEWRAGVLLSLPGMDRAKLRGVCRRLARYGLRLRRGRRWGVPAAAVCPAPAAAPQPLGDEPHRDFTRRKIVELWRRGVSQREISRRFNLGHNTHYQVWEIIQHEQRRRAADELRRHLGDPDWLVDVGSERLPDSTRWRLVVQVAPGAAGALAGLDAWRRRGVRVIESPKPGES
jgi:hypothetical protein